MWCFGALLGVLRAEVTVWVSWVTEGEDAACVCWCCALSASRSPYPCLVEGTPGGASEGPIKDDDVGAVGVEVLRGGCLPAQHGLSKSWSVACGCGGSGSMVFARACGGGREVFVSVNESSRMPGQ